MVRLDVLSLFFFFSSRRRHTRYWRDWSSDVCSSDLHDYKAAVSLFDSFPKDELFAARTDDLRRAVVELLSLEGDRVRLLGRRSSDDRSVSLIAALPAARYDAELLEAFTALLRDRFGTGSIDTHTVLAEGERVRVHVTVHAPEGVPDISLRDLE